MIKETALRNKLNTRDLKKELGFFSAIILVVANMIGTGIFTTSGCLDLRAINTQTRVAEATCW